MAPAATLARRLEASLTAVRVAIRRLCRLDSNPVPGDWIHVTKVDPEDDKRLPLLFPRYLSHTSAIAVGGSRRVGPRNTEETFRLLEWASPPVFHEPSAPDHVTEATREHAAFLAIPEVLNGDSMALVGTLGEGIDYVRHSFVPRELAKVLPSWIPDAVEDRLADAATSWLLEAAVFEAYIVQNPDSAAAREANVTAADVLTAAEARTRAMAAERHLGSEVIYLEYSGTFGGDEAVEIVETLRETVSWSRLWYGGGLDSAADVASILDAGADAVVVGDIFHEIATEERRVCERASNALGDAPSGREIDAWLERNVRVADHAATRYLSTVPGLDDPSGVARRYLAATIRTWIALAPTVGKSDTDVEAAPTSGMPSQPSSGPPERDDRAVESEARYVREVVRGLRGRGAPADRLPVEHLSVAEVLDTTSDGRESDSGDSWDS